MTGVYPPPGKLSRELARRLARRRRKLEGPWPVRLWRWLRAKLAPRMEGHGDKWPRWYAPPMGNEPATPAAIRARRLQAEADTAKLEQLKADVKARSDAAEAAYDIRWRGRR